ncbi:MAG: hypothetical protein A3K19_29240 [Lentisphaerae bacterium RIFOXYB12_FULL_65_16]|nr:MAG: hypothetical protein A3K18_13405 [Lentisphaerae bacterium RIFOXYA12_64_32]OGV88388.1 MAG: hypothetical protein A3K19_29240 [Lentisphaerae bacterium RIFOXYB12_FULL_65_16]
MIVLREDLREVLGALSFDQFMSLSGKTWKANPDGTRCTVEVEVGGRRFFVKRHSGVGWREIFKNLLQFRWPAVDASAEVRALQDLPGLGIPVPHLAAWGREGSNPARRRSFVMTDALEHVDKLDAFCPLYFKPPLTPDRIRSKHALICKIASLARRLHQAGLVHRDLYLCHILLDLSWESSALDRDRLSLFLADLHRVRNYAPRRQRWVIKDLAALYFSALDLPLTRRDRLRFIRAYRGAEHWRDRLGGEARFWQQVAARAQAMHRRLGPKSEG